MGLSVGIVGLPNVGKSTLFNALTNQNVYVANYPFATIEPNTCCVKFMDKRLDYLKDVFQSEKITYSSLTFVDIAGIIKGSSKGEGLGNKFLSSIRETNAIIQVVRCFHDESIIHVNGEIDPIRDIETIISELMLADITVIEKHLAKVKKRTKSGMDKELEGKILVCEKILNFMWNDSLAFRDSLTNEEISIIKELNLLTMKPMLFLLNTNDYDVSTGNNLTKMVSKYVNSKLKAEVLLFSAIFEEEIASIIDNKERNEMAKLMGLQEPIINLLLRKTLSLLKLNTFFTTGPKESKSWIYKKGMTAKQCAYLIHSDIGNRFIKLEVFNYKDFYLLSSKDELRKKGLIRIEGKDYPVKDGDICFFHFNK